MRAVAADNDIDSGVAKCKALFAGNFVHIDKSCKNLIKELESYQYDYDRLSSNLTEKPIKKADHSCDALRYGFTDYSPWHQRRLLVGGNLR
jgi:phage terminase large subunit